MTKQSYAGDITPSECYARIDKSKNGLIIDVRSRPEWSFVGIPAVNDLILAEWQVFPDMQINQNFIEQVSEEINKKGGNSSTPLYFLCRSGARSRSAAIAMTQAGFTECYNISDGFEGPPNSTGHRGKVAGWKAVNLPWRQN